MALTRLPGAATAPVVIGDAGLAPLHWRHHRRSWLPRVTVTTRQRVLAAAGVNSASSSSNGSGAHVSSSSCSEEARSLVQTRFVAETLLPTSQGKFRLRGYRHTVSVVGGQKIVWVAGALRRGATGAKPEVQAGCELAVAVPDWSVVPGCLQTDGGRTFVEPTAIISGKVEGAENVSGAAIGTASVWQHLRACLLAAPIACNWCLSMLLHTTWLSRCACPCSACKRQPRPTHPAPPLWLLLCPSLQLPLRVHDACFTSEVLGSLKCDCKEQLHLAMEFIRENPPGMIIYLQQEGRGIGLANKIAAYALQVGTLELC